jgi:hypothetical protein
MRDHEIETWALRIIEQVRHKRPIEDVRVELKTDWPSDPYDTARRIAGHANAARSEYLLWLIGVNERTGEVPGASKVEIHQWYAPIKKCFENALAPDMRELSIVEGGATVLALLFETTRIPFVVSNRKFGTKGEVITAEVPWRENTSIRSATRNDLLLLLSQVDSTPTFTSLAGSLSAFSEPLARGIRTPKNLTWSLNVTLFAELRLDQRLFIPFHQCSGTLTVPGYLESKPWSGIKFETPVYSVGNIRQNASLAIQANDDEVLIAGPGKLFLHATIHTSYFEFQQPCDAEVKFTISPALSANTVHFRSGLTFVPGEFSESERRYYWRL